MHEIFFVDRNDKPDADEPTADWQSPEAQEYWDDEGDLPF